MSKILIIAGEASGDIHGASLMYEMIRIDAELEFFGVGGDNMIEAGLKASFHTKDMAFLGFTEVVRHMPFIIKVQKHILALVKENNIKKAVLIDYPGFNLNLAKKLKKIGVKIFYYISPQIWAWGKHRIKKIKNRVDKMLVVFPFEEVFYRNEGVDTEFVGHPLIARLEKHQYRSRDNFFSDNNLEPGKKILLIMPGSRKHEIEKIFASVLNGAYKASEQFNMQIVVACANNIDESIFNNYDTNKFRVLKNQTYDLIRHSEFGIIKSGTSTMEASLIGLPFAVAYATTKLTYLIGRFLVNITSIAMPNIIAGKKVVKEFIQSDLTPENIYRYLNFVFNNQEEIEKIKAELQNIKRILGKKIPADLAAKIICSQG
ncbi:MAG: lipid-A-disaccharide synthase [Melioribacteraceae bacterium]|nr:lipid-A-disaccharide synthase [Melioribacteraceae bacterium]